MSVVFVEGQRAKAEEEKKLNVEHRIKKYAHMSRRRRGDIHSFYFWRGKAEEERRQKAFSSIQNWTLSVVCSTFIRFIFGLCLSASIKY